MLSNKIMRNYDSRIVWCSLIIATYTLIRSENSDVNERIYERIIELFFLNAFHFITEISSLINKTKYGCLESFVLCFWYFVWYCGSFIALVINEKINDLCTGVIFGHLIFYTCVSILFAFDAFLEYKTGIHNIDQQENPINVNQQNV